MKFSPRTQTSTDGNLGRGMDLALVTLVFLGLGYVLDRTLDTKPVFMIALFVFAAVGQFVKMWLGYDKKMRSLEAERASARTSASSATPPPTGSSSSTSKAVVQ